MTSDGVITIYHRPRVLRFIGLTQMTFGFFGALASIGIFMAWQAGTPELAGVGPLYSLIVFFGIAVPCLVIGNYVDDLRRMAVAAQIFYSFMAVGLCAFFLYWWGIDYHWNVPLFDMQFDVYVGNLAAGIFIVQLAFALYLVVKWESVVPPRGAEVVRDRKRARKIIEGVMASPLAPSLIAPDGEHELSDDEAHRILDVRRLKTEEGMAILCSNCSGATPLSEVEDDNTVHCDYCGVKLGVSGVFVPCGNHPEYLAATSCAVCGERYCRRCLTAQEPPVDTRWKGATIFLCRNCFEGRFRPAVTTTSLVIPIDQLFSKAGGRFSKIGGIYKRFLGAYARSIRYVLGFTLRIAAVMGRGSSGGGGRGGGGSDDAAAFLLVLVLVIIAIPIIAAVLLAIAGIIIIPILFYAGLVAVVIEAIRIIRRTDFMSLDQIREKGVILHKPIHSKDSALRDHARPWQKDDVDLHAQYQNPESRKQSARASRR